MSFQAYLDAAEDKTGRTPRELVALVSRYHRRTGPRNAPGTSDSVRSSSARTTRRLPPASAARTASGLLSGAVRR